MCSGLAEFSKTGEFSHVFCKLLVFIKLSRAKLILLSLLAQRSGCHFTTKQHNCLWGLHQDRSAERRPSFGGFGFVCGEMWFWTTSLVESESCNAVSLRQAAANLSFRLGGWLHLWKGFIGEEGWDMLVILSCFDASDQDRLLCHRVIKSYNAIGMENQLDRSLKSCLGSDGTLSVSFLALSKEPFPLLEGRLSALCQQLGESVGC